MIRLTDELATEVEAAAAESLEKYIDWYNVPNGELLDRKFAHLEHLSQVGEFFPPEPLHSGLVNESILLILVQLAVIQTLLDKQSSYR